jgi:hypothetical protein
MLHTHAVEKRVRVLPDVGARRLGQDEQYLTVREILSEASTLADGSLSRERSNFCRFGYATLGLTQLTMFSLRIGLPVSNGTSIES